MESLLDNKSDNFKFSTSFPLDVRAWLTERQTNIASILYSGVWTHSTPLMSLYTHRKYLKLSFLMFSGGIERHIRHEVGLRTLKSSRSQMFFRIGVHKNFAIFKEKHLSWSLFLIKLQTSSPTALLKRDYNSGIFLWILQNI